MLPLLVAGCAGIGNAPPGTPQPTQTGRTQPAPHPPDPQQAERIRRIMASLVAAMDPPRPLNQVKVGIMDGCWPMSSAMTTSATWQGHKRWALDSASA